MLALLNPGLFSDVTLLVDDVSIPAHKAILAHHSPVFKAMFSHNMTESLEGKVTIGETTADTLRRFLR